MNEVEQAKSRGEYRLAGQLARIRGSGPEYGCHYGMRSSRHLAIYEYQEGWNEIDYALRGGNNDWAIA